MAYATKANLDALMNEELYKHIDMRLVDRCAAKADAIINARLGQLYGVPFATPYPALVVNVAENLTLYYIYTSAFFKGKPQSVNEIRRELWDDSMDMLDKILSGDFVLTDVTLPASAVAGTRTARMTSTTSSYTPVFDLDNPIEWEVDEARLDDTETARQ